MKTILMSSLVFSSLAMAATPQLSTPIRTSAEIETSCRVKAKEIAAETYRSCVADQKSSQIEQIKKDYQAKLQALKAHYESEIKKMGGSKAKVSLEENEAAEAPADKADKSEQKIEDRVNNVNSAAVKSPVKKTGKVPVGAKKMAASSAKKASRKSGSSTDSSINEMTVQLKPAPVTPPSDESVMDLPEPIPVENVKTDSAI